MTALPAASLSAEGSAAKLEGIVNAQRRALVRAKVRLLRWLVVRQMTDWNALRGKVAA